MHNGSMAWHWEGKGGTFFWRVSRYLKVDGWMDFGRAVMIDVDK